MNWNNGLELMLDSNLDLETFYHFGVTPFVLRIMRRIPFND